MHTLVCFLRFFFNDTLYEWNATSLCLSKSDGFEKCRILSTGISLVYIACKYVFSLMTLCMNRMQQVFACQNQMPLKSAVCCQWGSVLSIRLVHTHLKLEIKDLGSQTDFSLKLEILHLDFTGNKGVVDFN